MENVVVELPPDLAQLEVPGPGTAQSAAPPPTAADEEACARLLARVDRRIEDLLSAEAARWGAVDARVAVPVAAVAELYAAGGKRLRPLFCAIGYLAAGGTADGSGADAVVDAAAALELLQVFALIHDDIMDNSSSRRGAPTVHARHADVHARHGWAGSPAGSARASPSSPGTWRSRTRTASRAGWTAPPPRCGTSWSPR